MREKFIDLYGTDWYNKVSLVMQSGEHSHNFEIGTYITTNAEQRDFRTMVNGGAGGALDRWGMYPNQA